MKITILAAAAALFATQASAVVVGGALTGGTALAGGGSFMELVGGGFSVGNDTFNDNNLYAFNENQNIIIPSEITVDQGTNPLAGQVVASHYVFFDPLGGATTAIGYVDFDAAIFGVATSTSTLAASDFLISNAVTYLNPSLRGLESSDSVSFSISEPNRLYVDLRAGSPGDYIRVFTMESPIAAEVPIPASGLLLLSALGLGSVLRRKGKAA